MAYCVIWILRLNKITEAITPAPNPIPVLTIALETQMSHYPDNTSQKQMIEAKGEENAQLEMQIDPVQAAGGAKFIQKGKYLFVEDFLALGSRRNGTGWSCCH